MLIVSEPSALTVSLHSYRAKSQCCLTSLCPFANGDWYSFCFNHKLIVYALACVQCELVEGKIAMKHYQSREK